MVGGVEDHSSGSGVEEAGKIGIIIEGSSEGSSAIT
jgi:hypothetical protein